MMKVAEREISSREIFGFEKGAFTGALKTTQGKFEQAHKGTLFLDEIGDMPPALQTKLLRVLENSTITRVGSTKDIKLDVRVVCATHKNLDELVTEKIFREDLLFRLNVFPINVPALVERSEDIPDLINHFLNQKKRIDQNSVPYFDEDAFDALKNYSWPGNIREVRNVVERAIMFFPAQKITPDDVNEYLIKVNLDVINRNEEQTAIWEEFDNIGKTENNEPTADGSYIPVPTDFSNLFEKQNTIDLRRLLQDIEIVLIEAAINRNNGNTSEAAKDLKLLRTTLIEKVKKYGL
jgi:sigma-54 specific flagellar transcriptional regulator A